MKIARVKAGIDLPKGEAAFNMVLRQYKAAAKRRDLSFNLTTEKFRELTKQNCFYCGKIPSQIMRHPELNGGYTYNGIDRIDNTVGYFLNNCVPCCYTCNRAKGQMTQEEFYNWAERVNSLRVGF